MPFCRVFPCFGNPRAVRGGKLERLCLFLVFFRFGIQSFVSSEELSWLLAGSLAVAELVFAAFCFAVMLRLHFLIK